MRDGEQPSEEMFVTAESLRERINALPQGERQAYMMNALARMVHAVVDGNADALLCGDPGGVGFVLTLFPRQGKGQVQLMSNIDAQTVPHILKRVVDELYVRVPSPKPEKH